ncbi:MAG: DEAD/DEAH box helicase [Bacillota bacterium]
MEGLFYNPEYFLATIPNIEENEYLREPQKIAYAKAYEHFVVNENSTASIIILPTGVGKTGLMGLLPYGISKGRVLIITPQLVIKDTVIGSLDPEYPDNFWITQKVFSRLEELPCLIEYEGKETKDEWLKVANIVVVNVQKLQARLDNSLIYRVPPDFFDLIIIDEAHHSPALTWVETLQHFSRAKTIKLTGTPFRTDREKIVGEIIYEYKLSAAMAHGYVKSLENFTYIPEQLRLTIDDNGSEEYTLEQIMQLGLRDQDWISRTVAYSIDCSEKIVLESIKKLEAKLDQNNTVPHKIIAVACSINHAEQIKELYDKYGYPAAIIHSEMEKAAKQEALLHVENHRVKVIIHVAMLGEGYDHPYLSIAAIFRPFRSLLPYAQFIGRVLRAISTKEASRPSDNIAEIICHRELNLDNLWQYYKNEIQESLTIKHLTSLDLEDDEELSADSSSKGVDKTVGVATETGLGLLIGDAFLNTEIIEQRRREEQEELEKVKAIQAVLGISAEDARKVILQTKNPNSGIRRPDLYIKRKRFGIDAQIKEEIVPSLLNRFSLDMASDELKYCRIFRGTKYGWISQRDNIDNAAMLAIYINAALKDMVGAKREDWTMSDWDIAEKKLEQMQEYLTKMLEEFTERT